MPDDSKTTPSPKSKPVTRSSIRQSLNLLSSKAFAGAISKDSKEATKNAKKTKDASRRNSALISLPSAPRASMGDVRPPSQSSKRTSTPDSKTVSRRRVSTSNQRASPDEQSPKPSESATPQPIAPITRTTTLRPRNVNGASALPKYRPKSAVTEIVKPPSPTRAGTRRRFSTSDDEKKEQLKPTPAVSPADKTSRPISPLPQRAALKTNLTNSVNATPPTTPSKSKLATPASAKGSPSRPAKIVKTTPAITTTIPRPPSSSSSSLLAVPNAASSITPKSSTPKGSTPKSSALKAKLGLSRSAQDKSKSTGGSTTIHYPPSRDSPSPLAQRTRRILKAPTTTSSSLSGQSGNMSHISEGTTEDEDSDAEDVALLLAPVAAISAPTPAMPRIRANRQRLAPQTPTRANLPGRSNISYASPLPPDTIEKSVLLRPPPRESASQRAMRGSIMSWEQLANEQSVSLGEDEFGRMLSEIPAPFRSGAVSPSLSSHIDIPESPCLSAIDSPGGYGSISQVLLPEVTPSPAMHQSLAQSRFNLSPDTAAMDASTCTLLRLQLAQAENKAKEHLFQIQAMEEEFHHVQQAHTLQIEEMQKQMQYMETQWRTNEEQNPTAAFLEEQIRLVQRSRDEAVAEAVARYQEEARISSTFAIRAETIKQEALSSARLAFSGWETLREACDIELNILQGDRALLSVLLAQLDQMSYSL